MTNSIQFCKTFKECVKEYKKQLNETRSDEDAAYFFNKTYLEFLKKHKEELNILGSINCEKPFFSWLKNYLLK